MPEPINLPSECTPSIIHSHKLKIIQLNKNNEFECITNNRCVNCIIRSYKDKAWCNNNGDWKSEHIQEFLKYYPELCV